MTAERLVRSRLLTLACSLAVLLLGTLLAAGAAQAAAVTYTVDSTADTSLTTCDPATANDCTLRGAITDANLNPGADTINFAIPGTGVKTITLTSDLPTITDAVTIDGYSQPNASANTLATGDNAVLLVELNATSSTYGLNIGATGGGSSIRGLVINRANDINVASGSNVISGNFIGTDPTGTTAYASGGEGISIQSGANNLIGGTTPAARNVVSVNGSTNEISLGLGVPPARATGTIIRGNYIGTNASGTGDLVTFPNGIAVAQADNTTIGGSDGDDGAVDGEVGARNVISGNSRAIYFYGYPATGVTISGNFIGVDATGETALGNDGDLAIGGNMGPDSYDNVTIGGTAPGAGNVISGNYRGFVGGAQHLTIQGNFVGTDLSGTKDLGNTTDGLDVTTAGNPQNPPAVDITIGGSTAAARNIISGNGLDGLIVSGGGAAAPGSVSVQGNYIGTQADGQTALANGGNGVTLTRQAAIGGTGVGEGNVIAHNAGKGVSLESSGGPLYSSPILGNSIFLNGALGIDLAGDGRTPNDAGDADTGPNGLQNFPVLTSATTAGSSATVSGTLNSTPSQTFRLEFFANAACNAAAPNDYGEGQTFIGSTSVTTDGSGNVSFGPVALSGVPAGQAVVTSTATNSASNDTSEFSQCVTASAPANTPPTAHDDSYTANENQTLNVPAPGVLSNDTDNEGDPLTAVKVSNPSHGSVTLNSNGSFAYTPNTGYAGPDSFTYRANDGSADSNTATVNLNVSAAPPANTPPTANDDAYTANENQTLNVPAAGVLANDTDAEHDPLTAAKVSNPAHGSVTLNSNGSFAYTPNTGYAGPDSFTYRANDGSANSNTATVSLNVRATAATAVVNTPPTARDDVYKVNENQALRVAAAGVLKNDSDPDHDPLTAHLMTGPRHGSVILRGDGSLAYVPKHGVSGADSFTYRVSDGRGGTSNTATVHVTVAPGPSCVVPKLVHKTLAQAKQLLRNHHCELGPVSGGRGGTVVKSSPRAGTVLAAGAHVALRLSAVIPPRPHFTG